MIVVDANVVAYFTLELRRLQRASSIRSGLLNPVVAQVRATSTAQIEAFVFLLQLNGNNAFAVQLCNLFDIRRKRLADA